MVERSDPPSDAGRGADFESGDTVAGKYRVLRELGRGGFGTVYLVEILSGMVGQQLALKVIPEELSGKDKVRDRFINEIRVAMRLVNKYIIQVRDVGVTEQGQLYYTMDYSPGRTLSEIIKSEGKLSIVRSILIILRVLRALFTAHDQGVIHRDLKPANVMVETSGERETARLLDFGIATAVQDQRISRGSFVGSPYYMPPEQFLGEKLGVYSDLYSVAVILYECVTGQRPYGGTSAQAVYNDMKSRPPVAPTQFNPEVEQFSGLNELILKALERNPEKRFKSAREFFGELNAILESWKTGRETRVSKPAKAGAAARRATRAAGRSPAPATRPAVAPGRPRQKVKTWKRRRSPAVTAMIAVASIMGLAVVGAFIVKNRPKNEPRTQVTDGERRTGPTGTSGEVTTPTPRIGSEPEADPEELEQKRRERARKFLAEAGDLAVKASGPEDWHQVRQLCDDALKIHDQLAEAYRLKGMAEYELEFYDHANGSLQAAEILMQGEKIPAELYFKLAMVAQRRKDAEPHEFEMFLAKTLEVEPGHVEATVLLLNLLDDDEDRTGIRAALTEAKTRGVTHARIDELWEKYFVTIPEQERAAFQELKDSVAKAFEGREYKTVIEKAPKVLERESSPEISFQLATALRETGEYRRSLEALHTAATDLATNGAELETETVARIALDMGRTNLLAHENLGEKKGQFLAEALLNLNSSIDLLGEDARSDQHLRAEALTYRARCHAYEGRREKVDEDLKRAADADDRSAELYLYQGETLIMLARKTRDADEREDIYGRAIFRLGRAGDLYDSRDELRGYTLYLGGVCYLEMGGKDGYVEAGKRFARAQNGGLKTPELYERWAEVAVKLNQLRDAAHRYRESYRLNHGEEACYRAAYYYYKERSFSNAEELLEDGLRRYPDATRLRSLLELVRS